MQKWRYETFTCTCACSLTAGRCTCSLAAGYRLQDTRISIVVVGTLKSVYIAIMHTPAVFNMYGTGYGLSVCFRVLCLHNKASRVCIRLQPMGQVGRISCAYIYISHGQCLATVGPCLTIAISIMIRLCAIQHVIEQNQT